MTKEEKNLLLKDLCGRLPYGVKCFCKWSKEAPNKTVGCIQEISAFLLDEFDLMDEQEYGCQVSEIKPYLRPMSSMTEEEKEEFRTLISPEASCAYEDCLEWDAQIIGSGYLQISVEDFSKVVDWLNVRHFDYRGLIPMGMALEAPEGIYKEE